jgi:serine/threonine protein kinase
VNVFNKEYIDLLRQYVLSDEQSIKAELLESFPFDMREKVMLIQQEFEKGAEAKSIAKQIAASDFETEIEEIQSSFFLKKLGIDEQDFEKEIQSSITSLERESLKKKLIAFEESQGEEPSDLELKSAVTQIERESLKKIFQDFEDSLDEANVPIYPLELPGADLKSAARPAASIAENILLHSFLKYAVAACFILAIGVGIYQFTKQDSVPENILANSSEVKLIDQKTNELTPSIEALPLAEISATSDSYLVLKSGLGYGEVEEKVTIVLNNQKDRIASIEKAISTYSNQLVLMIENPDAEQSVFDLKNRISSLQSELTQLKSKERQYVFDGNVLNIFTSSIQTENKILRLGNDFYLKSNAKFFKLTLSKEPKTLLEETEPNVLKALDQIIFNAE